MILFLDQGDVTSDVMMSWVWRVFARTCKLFQCKHEQSESDEYFAGSCCHSGRPCSLPNFRTTSWTERAKAKMRHPRSQRTFLRHFWAFWVPFTGFSLIETHVSSFFIENLTRWFQFCLGFCCDSKLVTSPLCTNRNSKKHSCRASFSQHKQMVMWAEQMKMISRWNVQLQV